MTKLRGSEGFLGLAFGDGKGGGKGHAEKGEACPKAMAQYLLLITADGYAKRTPLREFKPRRRGAKGVSGLTAPHELGGAAIVGDDEEVLVLTRQGVVLRVTVKEVAILSRSGRGGRIIQLREGDRVVSVIPLRAMGEASRCSGHGHSDGD